MNFPDKTFQKKKVIFLGTTDFPFGMAEVEKQTLIARSLHEEGCQITFLCKRSYNYTSTLKHKGEYKGLKYIYTSLSIKRLKNKILNRFSWYFGDILEILYLLFLDFDYAIVSSRSFNEINSYSRIIHSRKKKLFLTHVEDFRSMHPDPDSKQLKLIEDFEKKTWFIINGAFPISDELNTQIKKVNPKLPTLKVPVLVDPEEINLVDETDPITGKYFMFCGSSDYLETIELIVKGYELSNSTNLLLLVLNGSPKSLTKVHDRIKDSTKKEQIILKSYLKRDLLTAYYKRATALLIPLNFNLRDKSRFPHKIGEYCASGSPIISSDWGEVSNYFTHMENALLLKSKDPKELCDALLKIENSPELQAKLSKGSLLIAKERFSYKLFGESLLTFMVNPHVQVS